VIGADRAETIRRIGANLPSETSLAPLMAVLRGGDVGDLPGVS